MLVLVVPAMPAIVVAQRIVMHIPDVDHLLGHHRWLGFMLMGRHRGTERATHARTHHSPFSTAHRRANRCTGCASKGAPEYGC